MDEVMGEVERLLQQIQDKIDWLRDKINGVLEKVPGWLDWVVGKVQEAWNEFIAKVGELWDWFTDKLAYAGDPGGLDSLATRWTTEIATVTSAQAHEVDSGDLMVDDRWQGDAAEQYRQKVPEQKSTLEAIRGQLVTAVTGALDTLRMGIITFWVGVGTALLALVGGLAGAATATGTIVGLPAAPVIAGIAVAVALAALGSTYWVLTSQAASAELKMRGAQSYGLDQWPSFAL